MTQLPFDSTLLTTTSGPIDNTIKCVERWDSRPVVNGRDPTTKLIYSLFRSEDEALIRAKLEDTAPALYEGLDADDYSLDPLGGGVWTATVNYKIRNPSSEEFDTTGGSAHVTQSQNTSRFGTNAPDFYGAIGVTDDRIEGVDITIPAYRFSFTHYVPRYFVNQTYKNTLFQRTGKVNNASFKGFAAGEVLFLGSRGFRRGRDDFELNFQFVASPNIATLAIAPGITVTNKQGWDYLWVLYSDVIDTTANRIVKRPRAAYVERVYARADLGSLGLGT